MIKRKRKAIKYHYCIECNNEIEPNEYYLEITGDDGYHFWTIRKCKYCCGWEKREENEDDY